MDPNKPVCFMNEIQFNITKDHHRHAAYQCKFEKAGPHKNHNNTFGH